MVSGSFGWNITTYLIGYREHPHPSAQRAEGVDRIE